MPEDRVLGGLERVIVARKEASPDRSYTSRLLTGGLQGIGDKVTEEAGELVRAACEETDQRVTAEAADLLYHVLVLLAARDVPLAAVMGELARRSGISGLEEKASRSAAGRETTDQGGAP
jgi:phosphoribosyl-ATP pyrophosphohydrolase